MLNFSETCVTKFFCFEASKNKLHFKAICTDGREYPQKPSKYCKLVIFWVKKTVVSQTTNLDYDNQQVVRWEHGVCYVKSFVHIWKKYLVAVTRITIPTTEMFSCCCDCKPFDNSCRLIFVNGFDYCHWHGTNEDLNVSSHIEYLYFIGKDIAACRIKSFKF